MILYRLLSTFFFLNFLAVAWLFWMMFHPVELAEIYNEPFPIYPQEVKKGEELHYTIHFKKTKNYRVTSNKNIVCEDGNLVTLAPQTTNASLGEYKASSKIVIPENITLGVCYIEFKTTYHINPLRDMQRTLKTQKFTIIE